MFSQLMRVKPFNFGKLATAALQKVINEHEVITRASAVAFDAILAFIPTITLYATIAASFCPVSQIRSMV